ncbi:hypothetical protein K0M31_002805 [Melipona bicolor]|uniref:Uncharacterized protein n=1 Tax=Melipona bicolor TaxID=60889 RepID=A0AA40KPU9_9HYME|nr:hypothetical protein K0M31_002805 [Melipona bicolor]
MKTRGFLSESITNSERVNSLSSSTGVETRLKQRETTERSLLSSDVQRRALKALRRRRRTVLDLKNLKILPASRISRGKVNEMKRTNQSVLLISSSSFKPVTSRLLSPRAEGGEREDLATPASFASDDGVGSRCG